MIETIEKIVSEWKEDLFKFSERDYHKTKGQSSDSYERVYDWKPPSRELLCLEIGVCRETLKNWENAQPKSINKEIHERYLGALSKIEMMQKVGWMAGAAQGKLNANIAKLVLMSNHGMTERSDTTSGDEKIDFGVVYLPKRNEDK